MPTNAPVDVMHYFSVIANKKLFLFLRTSNMIFKVFAKWSFQFKTTRWRQRTMEVRSNEWTLQTQHAKLFAHGLNLLALSIGVCHDFIKVRQSLDGCGSVFFLGKKAKGRNRCCYA